MEEDNFSNEKKNVSFHSENLSLTKAKEKREVFVNVQQKKTFKQSAEEFQKKFAAAKDRKENLGAEANGIIKSRKPISKKPFIILGVIIILGIALYIAFPTIKYYVVPSEERGFEILRKNPQKGTDYLYKLYADETPEEKSKSLLKIVDDLYEFDVNEHIELIGRIVYDAEEISPSSDTARAISEYEFLCGNEEKYEEWFEIAESRPKKR